MGTMRTITIIAVVAMTCCLGIKSDEHTALTYTLSKNAETGAITVTYSEPQGFPFQFHWTATVSIDGTTTTTPIMVERRDVLQRKFAVP